MCWRDQPEADALGPGPTACPRQPESRPVPAKHGPRPTGQAGCQPGRELSSPKRQGQSCPPRSSSLPVAEVGCPSRAVASAQQHAAGLLEKRRREPVRAVREKAKRPPSPASLVQAIYRSGLAQPGLPPGPPGTTTASARPEGSLAEPTPNPTAQRRRHRAAFAGRRPAIPKGTAPASRTRGRAGPDRRRLGKLALPRLGARRGHPSARRV